MPNILSNPRAKKTLIVGGCLIIIGVISLILRHPKGPGTAERRIKDSLTIEINMQK